MMDSKRIKDRYEKAKTRARLWQSNLQLCYELTMPNRANFTHKEWVKGQRKTQDLYDSTVSIGLGKYASNLQSLLFGVKNWARVVPGSLVKDGKTPISTDQAEKEVEKYTEMFFSKLNTSNFQMAVYQCLMEMGISTGVLLVNEGTPDAPFKFMAVPLHEVSLEAGPDDSVQNVYREYKLTAAVIPQTWPKAKIDQNLSTVIEKEPSQEIELIEGTVYNPNAPRSKQYAYFVMQKGKEGYLVYEERSYSPWIVFRPKVLAGEIFGRGVLYDMLPSIKVLNRSMEYLLRSASFNAIPIFTVPTGSEINPYTARIAPGSILPVQPNGTGKGVDQLTIKASADEMMAMREVITRDLIQALELNPIGDNPSSGDPSQTATEANLRNQEHIKQQQAMYNRLQYELSQPLFKTCWHIMFKLGLVPFPHIDGKHIGVEFNSPVQEMAKQQEIMKLITASNQIQQALGPQIGEYGLMFGYQPEKVPEFILKNNDVNFELIRGSGGQQQMLKAVAALTGQNPQAPQGLQPGQAVQPLQQDEN